MPSALASQISTAADEQLLLMCCLSHLRQVSSRQPCPSCLSVRIRHKRPSSAARITHAQPSASQPRSLRQPRYSRRRRDITFKDLAMVTFKTNCSTNLAPLPSEDGSRDLTDLSYLTPTNPAPRCCQLVLTNVDRLRPREVLVNTSDQREASVLFSHKLALLSRRLRSAITTPLNP
jgi:hypothetical protein